MKSIRETVKNRLKRLTERFPTFFKTINNCYCLKILLPAAFKNRLFEKTTFYAISAG